MGPGATTAATATTATAGLVVLASEPALAHIDAPGAVVAIGSVVEGWTI
jgi:hypothetical protein